MEIYSKKSIRLRRLVMALASFFIYLLAYALFLVLEGTLGGGQAYLWFLFLAPCSFVLYALAAGAVSYLVTRRIGMEALYQTLALFLFFVVGVCVDLWSGRTLLSEIGFSDYLLDVCGLVACPVLIFCGGRIARFFVRIKEKNHK